MTIPEIAEDLADFGHYPPAKNSYEGTCLVCPETVPEGAGFVVLGGKDGRNYGAYLHHECAALVRREQEAETARRRAARASR